MSKIKELAEKYKLNKDEDFWLHPQSQKWILKHDAIERIAVKEGVEQGAIQPLNSTETLVRFLVTMKLGERVVTSVGEADTKNCRMGYLGCMAEKRGIDRCVLKLIEAYEYGVYSEVEADDFAKTKEVKKASDKQKKLIATLINETGSDPISDDEYDKLTLVEASQYIDSLNAIPKI